VRLPVKITINGRAFEREVEPRLLLVHFLREVAGFTGTKIGCDTSQCGACTVLVDGLATKSCTRLAVQADGTAITTIEGLAAANRFHPVQESFWNKHGLQCGFCTPGMILTAVALLEETPRPTPEAVRHALEGNLCRCTGYQNIVRAVCDVAAAGGR
jgi:carbon-monoxide dehydrogenase small subunit